MLGAGAIDEQGTSKEKIRVKRRFKGANDMFPRALVLLLESVIIKCFISQKKCN